jgi:hypothetical protein
MASKRRPGAPADLEELRPQLFLVHNPAMGPTLRGEGEREGDRFRLTSWRRDGLMARLRARGFAILTLADQVAALPALPQPPSLGPALSRALAGGERLSVFAANPLGWHPAPADPAAPGAVLLHEGQVIRRRKGRGPGSFYQVAPGTLRPLDEDAALRLGYASLDAPVPLEAQQVQGKLLLPDLPLPRAHRTLLGRFAEPSAEGWRFAPEELPLVEALLGRLGLIFH